MKMKHVFLVLFALILAVSFTGSALGSQEGGDASRDVQITYDVSDSYYIVVPSAIKINEVASVTVTEATIAHNGYLNLSISEGQYVEDEHRRMRHTTALTDFLKYDIWYEVDAQGSTINRAPTPLGIGEEITIVDARTMADIHMKTIVTHIQPQICAEEDIPTSGSYADTVQFNIKVYPRVTP